MFHGCESMWVCVCWHIWGGFDSQKHNYWLYFIFSLQKSEKPTNQHTSLIRLYKRALPCHDARQAGCSRSRSSKTIKSIHPASPWCQGKRGQELKLKIACSLGKRVNERINTVAKWEEQKREEEERQRQDVAIFSLSLSLFCLTQVCIYQEMERGKDVFLFHYLCLVAATLTADAAKCLLIQLMP